MYDDEFVDCFFVVGEYCVVDCFCGYVVFGEYVGLV